MNTTPEYYPAPEIEASAWLNSREPLLLSQLKGKIVVIMAFQMLCPGCVSGSIPQLKKLQRFFPDDDFQIIGLHSVFEHHDVMTPAALKAFVHEYNITFPVAIDKPSDTGPIPATMMKYGMQGTPTLIIIDHNGAVRVNHFGHIDDIQLGSVLGTLQQEKRLNTESSIGSDIREDSGPAVSGCTDDQCFVPHR